MNCQLFFYLTTRSTVHTYNTRYNKSSNIPKTKLKLAEKCLRYVIPITINSTESCIVEKINTYSLQGFIQYIKQHFINGYQSQ